MVKENSAKKESGSFLVCQRETLGKTGSHTSSIRARVETSLRSEILQVITCFALILYRLLCLCSWIGLGQFYLSWFLLAVEAVLLWVILIYIQRYLLKALLIYKGWMFDPRG